MTGATKLSVVARADAKPQRAKLSRRSAAAGRSPAGRCRMHVVTGTVDAAVREIGGWMADLAFAGWEVDVFVLAGDDFRRLEILGAHGNPLPPGALPTGPQQRADAVAVAADVLRDDDRIRRWVLDLAARGPAEVVVWGSTSPYDGAGPVEHVLSSAARAFKAHALSAERTARPPVPPTEILWRGTAHRGTSAK
ncbi:hypothetical protein [Nocardia sp. BMG111209]|uniref:hypothetical protein n=1 Tax=Nocardia sp. BMG111209 TaxID=1160137 RepID=UPI00038136BB|nr:hypothetical protein [Nocardia sp. BMG111209]